MLFFAVVIFNVVALELLLCFALKLLFIAIFFGNLRKTNVLNIFYIFGFFYMNYEIVFKVIKSDNFMLDSKKCQIPLITQLNQLNNWGLALT